LTPPPQIERDYLASGLAASFTSSVDNPYFKIPTARDERNGAVPAAFTMFAPYYIGTSLSPEQIANDVASRGALYLKRLDLEHGYDGYVGRLLSVLRKGHVAHEGLQAVEDRNALFDAHDFMASITRRLHHIAPLVMIGGKSYSAAEVYRAATHEIIDPYINTLDCEPTPDGYKERFELPEYIRSDPAQLVELGWDFFDTRALRRGAEFAALAAEKVGDPLVRSWLSEHYLPPYLRRRQYLFAAG
jgi:hypothetical protein